MRESDSVTFGGGEIEDAKRLHCCNIAIELTSPEWVRRHSGDAFGNRRLEVGTGILPYVRHIKPCQCCRHPAACETGPNAPPVNEVGFDPIDHFPRAERMRGIGGNGNGAPWESRAKLTGYICKAS